MFSIFQIYELFIEERDKVLNLFKEVDKEHFYHMEGDNTWSAEMLFRHLLMSCYWMLGFFLGEQVKISKLALNYGKVPDENASLEKIEVDLHRISKIILERMKALTPEMEEEIIKSWWGEVPRQTACFNLVQHDCEHIGQIRYLFKRCTGWTDEKIYDL